MPLNLVLTIIISSVLLIVLTTYFLKKGRIPEKYALLWYLFALIILIIGIFPGMITGISELLGFKVASNMIIVAVIGIQFLLIMVLTIMMAGQKKKTTLLIQEISLLKQKIEKGDK